MEFKQMHTVIHQLGIEKITLVDAIGRDVPIPKELCLTYNMLLEVISIYFKHQKAPGSDFVERGDYRLVHGNSRNLVGPTEWNLIDKAGLRVEMSMILRTRKEDKMRCPSCRTGIEGGSVDGWAQCVSCSVHFQIETKVQAKLVAESGSEGKTSIEPSLVSPVVKESTSSEYTSSGAAQQLPFCLISVINLLEQKQHGQRSEVDQRKFGSSRIPSVAALQKNPGLSQRSSATLTMQKQLSFPSPPLPTITTTPKSPEKPNFETLDPREILQIFISQNPDYMVTYECMEGGADYEKTYQFLYKMGSRILARSDVMNKKKDAKLCAAQRTECVLRREGYTLR